jgi:hypothetical protein
VSTERSFRCRAGLPLTARLAALQNSILPADHHDRNRHRRLRRVHIERPSRPRSAYHESRSEHERGAPSRAGEGRDRLASSRPPCPREPRHARCGRESQLVRSPFHGAGHSLALPCSRWLPSGSPGTKAPSAQRLPPSPSRASISYTQLFSQAACSRSSLSTKSRVSNSPTRPTR